MGEKRDKKKKESETTTGGGGKKRCFSVVKGEKNKRDRATKTSRAENPLENSWVAKMI